jgi:hypothetical protein
LEKSQAVASGTCLYLGLHVRVSAEYDAAIRDSLRVDNIAIYFAFIKTPKEGKGRIIE